MSIRRKILFVILGILLLLFVVIYVSSNIILLGSFDELQKQALEQNLQRGVNALDNETQRLISSLADWAYWDDTYAFVQNGNPDYIDTNVSSSTLPNLQLSFMIFVNKSDEVVFAKGYDLANQTEAQPPADLISQESHLRRQIEPSEITRARSGNPTRTAALSSRSY